MGVKLAATSGGSVELVPTNTASNFTATMPARTGNVAVDGPAFSAYTTANTGYTSGVATKVAFNTEVFDTNNNFDSTTNYRFTPTVAGYYQLNSGVYVYSSSATSIRYLRLFKNGATYQAGVSLTTSPPLDTVLTYSGLVYFNGSTDYAEIYVFDNGTSPVIYGGGATSLVWFSGALVRAA